ILEKSDAAEGFAQIIDFLSGSYIHYAFTVNPYIYISCIKQFWNTTAVKRSGDVTRVGKGFSGVETPLFEGMLAIGQPAEEGLVAEQVQVDDVAAAAVEEHVAEDVSHDTIPSPHVIPSPSREPSSPPQQQPSSPQALPQDAEFPPQLQQVLNICSALFKRVENLKNDNAAQKLGRMIADMDMNEGIELVKDAKEDDSEVQEVAEVVTTAKLITKVVIAAASQVSDASTTIPAASATIPAAKPTIHAAAPPVDRGKGILVETPKPMKKKDQIEMDAEYARKLQEEIDRDHDGFNKDIDWDTAMDHVNQKSSNPQYIKRYQGIKKRPQTESEACKNMMIYLKNTVGYKMYFFKGMTYAQICLIFQARFDENIRFLFKSREEIEAEDQEIIKSINETPAQKASKRRKLSEEAQEAEDLRKRLEVVEDEDDDVFVDATPLAQKVPVVDY
nr:hypothetical protein [Tanacetum cinerariifolium]